MTLRLFTFCLTAAAAAAAPHWAFQPLGDPVPPAVRDAAWPQSDVDRFVLAKWEAGGQVPAPPAERRELLRRATYDLTGLPPSVAEMDAFMADTSAEAFAKAVDRLLASPAYGEKWGRFWLDVVRYSDTAGENTDRPLPHAWRYRNWVLQAFNGDLPYDEFIRWQIAGDLLTKTGPEASANDKIVATGYLAIARRFGHDIEKDMHLTFEDTIDTMGKSLLGLTLGCARCHDHKYDPVSTRDYYGLYGILQSTRFPFTGCEPKPQPRDMVPLETAEGKARRMSWEADMEAAAAAVKQAEEAAAKLGSPTAGSTPVLVASGELDPGKSQEMAPVELTVAQGEMLQLSILPRGNYGADSTGVEWEIAESGGTGRKWNLGSDFVSDSWQNGGGMQRTDSYGNPAVWHLLDLVPDVALLTDFVRDAEQTPGLMVWRGSGPCPSFVVNTKDAPVHFITVTMPPKSVGLHPGPNGGVAVAWQSPAALRLTVRGKVSEIDPGGDGIAWRLERRPGIGTALAARKSTVQQLAAAKKTRDEKAAAKPSGDLAYAVAEAPPANARVQKKGEPKDPGDEVPRKMLDILGGAVVPADAGSGRLQLADWLTRGAAQGLTARVMVNRIWQGHFGDGIVPTPNDFGTRGSPPSDPALLDWLASRFIADGWSIKSMHRRLMLSAAYQRRSQGTEGGDHHQAFFPRRRLTAEELRDTLLLLSGNLDPSPGGAHPFPAEATWTFTQHNPFAAVYEHNRRSVYLMVQRTRRHPFLALFDAGDPNASTPVRSQSTVPTQALYFLNDPFVHVQAKAMAARLIKAAPEDTARMDLAARELYGRPAGDSDRAVMQDFLAATAANIPGLTEPERSIELWAAWLRVLLGTNELLYVD